MAVDVEWIRGQITQILHHNEIESRAVDGRQVECASVAWIVSVQVETNHSTCCVNNSVR